MKSPRRNLEQVKARIAHIEEAIRRNSEDFFSDEDLEVLRIAIRIACEFSDFLEESSDPPDLYDAEYMAGTIRAGIDEFVRVSQWGRILTGSKWASEYHWNPPKSFAEMKESYSSIFRQLPQCASTVTGVEMLLSLAQTMIFFMGVFFPWL